MNIPIEISARHIHLSKVDTNILFGQDYELKVQKNISQPNQFATQETVKIIGPKGDFEKVRIVGPIREYTQVELSVTDCYFLGIKPKFANSGDIDNSIGGLKIIGPKGEIELEKGVMVAKRHLHLTPQQATDLGLNHLDVVSIKTVGERALIFNNVIVRARKNIDSLGFHIDTDEANAAGIQKGDQGIIID